MSDLAPSWLCEQIEQVLRHLIFLPGTPDLIYLLLGHQKSGCSGQPIPDSGLSFSSATAGGNPSLN